MTKVMMNIKDGEIFFDCENHADDYDVCTIISTLCNVLVTMAERCGTAPAVYKAGHVRIYIREAEAWLIEGFEAVREVIEQVEAQNPKIIRIY